MSAEVVGAGRDLVLLHSLLADRTSFRKLADALAAQRRLVLMDLPGFGSAPPAEPIDGYAESIAATIAGMGLATPVDILGNGLGGFVALALAARRPGTVSRLVLIGGGIAFPEAGRATFRGLADKVERDGMAAVADAAVQRMLTAAAIAADPDLAAACRARFVGLDPGVFAAAARALADLDLGDRLAAVRCPVLIVVGEKDGATPPAMGRALAERLPDAALVELPGVGHAPHLHAVGAVVDAIAPFLGLTPAARP